MPGYPVPNSGGAPQPDNAISAKPMGAGYLPSGKPGGQLAISRREALALIAFDTEDDESAAIKRARRETALDDDQLARLKSRADKARGKGYTLINGTHKFMPTNYDGDQDSLLGAEEQKADSKTLKMRDGKRAAKQLPDMPAEKASKPDARSTRKTQESWSRVHECDGDEKCGACRAAHTAAAPAREAFRRRQRHKKRLGNIGLARYR